MRARVGFMRAWPDDGDNSNNEESGAAVAPPPRAEVAAPPDAERKHIDYTSQGGAETAAAAAAGLAAPEQQMTKLASSDSTTGRDPPAGCQAETAVEKGKAEAAADPYSEYDLADKDAPEKASQATELWSESEISVSDAAVAAIGKNKEAQGEVSVIK